jgi:hypothetical protein
MEYIEDVVTILSKLNLDDIEQTISEPYIKKDVNTALKTT